ncbi:MAG: glucose-6-phosphate isomerase, partial [Verrucomicrobiaceae bacterium]
PCSACSRMRFEDDFLSRMEPLAQKAVAQVQELERGGIANPDENRMVGHYWLRNSQLAPTQELREEIEQTNASIRSFVQSVHEQGRFTDVLLVGIGGSALGPQFVSDALGTDADPIRLHFFDNTDPDGFDRVLKQLENRLEHTLTVVISKSGGTKETRNGMVEAAAFYSRAGLSFEKHAVAVTGAGSELDKVAEKEGWLARFPMWDWVGGRTSVMSAVGLLPLSLQGLNMEAFLQGAAAMDEWTRTPETLKNPSMLLALMWHYAGNGRGEKDMVVLPYKDRLTLFSKYLQQLVMESLGKELDLDGNKVNQGIAVYGNKGSTDQHAYVQQLRDGVANFFVTFIEVLKDRSGKEMEVEPGITSGDYLQGFLRGTRTALYEGGRDSITVTIPAVTPFTVGALIALYERAVGFYASLVNINAYHQPGVEAGKKAATAVLNLQLRVRQALAESGTEPRTATEIASGLHEDPESVFHVLQHLATNNSSVKASPNGAPSERTFSLA